MSGGAKAVAHTQKLQMIIVFISLFLIGYIAVKLLPGNMGFTDAVHEAAGYGKMNVITSGVKNGSFDWKDKYNIWSGLIGGFFFSAQLFRNGSQPGRSIPHCEEQRRKQERITNERSRKSAHAILYPAHRRIDLQLLPVS